MPIQQPTFVPTLNVDVQGVLDIQNIQIPVATANTEVSQLLPDGVKSLRIRCEQIAELKYSFVAGESGTNYWSVFRGTCDNLNTLDLVGKTIYIQSDRAPVNIQIQVHL